MANPDVFFSLVRNSGQEALSAIYNCLQAYLNPTSIKFIIQVVINARFNTIELFIRARDENLKTKQYRDKKPRLDAISNHSLAHKEMLKENEDLQLLKGVESLESSFLESLRYSNNGRSLINLKFNQ